MNLACKFRGHSWRYSYFMVGGTIWLVLKHCQVCRAVEWEDPPQE